MTTHLSIHWWPGFDSSSVTFSDDDDSDSTNSQLGQLPDGEFSETRTKLEFCCTKYGFPSDEIQLPRTKPFALLRSSDRPKSYCHTVRGRLQVKVIRGWLCHGQIKINCQILILYKSSNVSSACSSGGS